MSALAVFFERAGIATVVVGLVRLHLEVIQPPRALWVPFELGRPLGGYVDDGQFQRQVLYAALKLFERSDGPVILEDFEREDPGASPDLSWQPPALGDACSIVEEVRMLQSQWLQAQQRLGRTTTGLSGMSIEHVADYLDRFNSSTPATNPDESMSPVLRMRFCADDIKAYFQEAALANGIPSSAQIGDWFWNTTYSAQRLQQLREENLAYKNAARAPVSARFIVPGSRLV